MRTRYACSRIFEQCPVRNETMYLGAAIDSSSVYSLIAARLRVRKYSCLTSFSSDSSALGSSIIFASTISEISIIAWKWFGFGTVVRFYLLIYGRSDPTNGSNIIKNCVIVIKPPTVPWSVQYHISALTSFASGGLWKLGTLVIVGCVEYDF